MTHVCITTSYLEESTSIYCYIASKSRSKINKLKKDLSSEFKMKDLGEVKKGLGMEIERDVQKEELN